MSQPLHMLLVDDSRDDRTLLIRKLRKSFPGLHVEEIVDARCLDDTLERGEFQLVITDYRMCWTNGIDVLAAIKDRFPDCPVIMFTGMGDEEVAAKAMKRGLDDYVVKKLGQCSRINEVVRTLLEKTKTT